MVPAVPTVIVIGVIAYSEWLKTSRLTSTPFSVTIFQSCAFTPVWPSAVETYPTGWVASVLTFVPSEGISSVVSLSKETWRPASLVSTPMMLKVIDLL